MHSTSLRAAAAVAVALSFSTTAYAQGSIYTQLSAGVNLKSNIRTPDLMYDDGLATFDGYIRGNSEPRITAGIEVGGMGIAQRFRAGVSYDYASMGLETIDVVGTLNGVDIDETIAVEDLGLGDVGLVTKAHFLQGQAAVTLTPQNSPVDAYIGAGAGAAFANDADTGLALSGTAGVDFPMGRGFAAGLRYRYIRASNWADEAGGFEYEPADLHLFSFTVTVSDGQSGY